LDDLKYLQCSSW